MWTGIISTSPWCSSGGCRPNAPKRTSLRLALLGLLCVQLCLGQDVSSGHNSPVPLEEEEKGLYIGCFQERIDLYDALVYAGNANGCVEICERAYFRYAALSANKCACSTEYDDSTRMDAVICNIRCKRNRAQFCGGIDAQSYYGTGVKDRSRRQVSAEMMSNNTIPVSGPPTNLRILEQDEHTMGLYWNDPPQASYLSNFLIKATILKTFATFAIPRQIEWGVDKEKRHFDLITLQPGTLYNISVTSVCEQQPDCGTAFIVAETLIDTPDPLPMLPKILEQRDTTIKVYIPEAINNNGPVSYYRLVVMLINDALQLEFDETLLGSYNRSIEDNIQYYITAEFAYMTPFIVGDGQIYGEFYNAPLPENAHAHISLGIVSIYKGIKKIAYSIATHEQHTHVLMDNMTADENETSIVALSVACAIFGLLLVASFIVYGYLRFKTANRPHRLSDTHELTLQGPMVEVENNGYVAESQKKESFMDQLNTMLDGLDSTQKFPRNSVRLNIDNILAQGNFGDVMSGKLTTSTEANECLVHVISDDMEMQYQTILLKDLKQLLQLMPHEKFLTFYGVSASVDWFYLIFELPAELLKKRLVESRVPPSVNNLRFSSVSEETILQWIYDISVGMEYLEANKTVHKNLCSYAVYVTGTQQIKLSLFGPPRLTDQEKPIDISRWMAPEVLRFQHHSTKSDVWSFACLAWECCTLGGTLYANITSQDLLPRMKNGLRPEQPPFIFNDLYQLFLNCWQLEPSERPDFEDVAFNVRQALTSPRHCLSYDRMENILIPYYLPLLEIQN